MTRGPDAGEEETIPGGVNVTSSITANVWEVHVKVRRVIHLWMPARTMVCMVAPSWLVN